jgi:hypothetical protein
MLFFLLQLISCASWQLKHVFEKAAFDSGDFFLKVSVALPSPS